MTPNTTPTIRIRMTRRHRAIVVPGLALLSGCTVINVGAGQTADITSVGLVRVRVPVSAENLVAIERTGAGAPDTSAGKTRMSLLLAEGTHRSRPWTKGMAVTAVEGDPSPSMFSADTTYRYVVPLARPVST